MMDLSVPSLFNVKGKVAVISGGGSGIGKMIASAYVRNGAKVYIASRKEKQLQEVTQELNANHPGSCEYIIADLGSKEGCDALIDAIKQKENKIHILVNNSGTAWGAPFNDFPEKQGWDKIMALNVKSIFYMTAGLSDLLAKDSTALDPARVINISSVAGLDPRAEGAPLAGKGNGYWSYNTSKAALNHLTQQLALTLAKRFVTVNAILPGTFPSKATAQGIGKAGDRLAAAHPMGRIGSARDMAGLVLFLASPASAHITGAIIPIDGGALLSRHEARL